jgi:activating signal cointegrator 1
MSQSVTLKALPLWQPWASLVAIGAKRVETRGYPAKRLGFRPGQRIAIHACKRTDDLWLCEEYPFSEYDLDADRLPLGAIVATCTLRGWTEVSEANAAELQERHPHEHAFGLYTPGRWGWRLTDVERLPEPIPFRGSQGTFDVPADLLAGVAR